MFKKSTERLRTLFNELKEMPDTDKELLFALLLTFFDIAIAAC